MAINDNLSAAKVRAFIVTIAFNVLLKCYKFTQMIICKSTFYHRASEYFD